MKFAIISGSFFAGLTVILGAFGAHALKDQLSDYSKVVYEKAIFYQMFHSLGLLLLGIIGNQTNQDLSLSVWFFILGIILFSGSLYILAITDIKWLGMITPFGGMLFILGWILVIVKFIK